MSGFGYLRIGIILWEIGFVAPRARIHLRGALYHVISRGNQRQKIYKDEEDHCRFEALLGEVAKRHSIMLYAYILMPNHFHLLLKVGHTHLTKAMQSLLYRYTRHYNRRYRKIHHLFQGPTGRFCATGTVI